MIYAMRQTLSLLCNCAAGATVNMFYCIYCSRLLCLCHQLVRISAETVAREICVATCTRAVSVPRDNDGMQTVCLPFLSQGAGPTVSVQRQSDTLKSVHVRVPISSLPITCICAVTEKISARDRMFGCRLCAGERLSAC
jgi:hypothetical protein